jgi:hypothetical protein
MKYQALADSIKSFEERKDNQQGEGHIRLIWLVEVKLCNTVRIRVRVSCSADQLT